MRTAKVVSAPNSIPLMQAMAIEMMLTLYEQKCHLSPIGFLRADNIEMIRTRAHMIAEEMKELTNPHLNMLNTLDPYAAETHKLGAAELLINALTAYDYAPTQKNAEEVIKQFDAYIDALTDLLVFIFGGFAEAGINAAAPYAEVMRSNMSKMGADGKPIKRADGKVLKGPNYSPPHLEVMAPHYWTVEKVNRSSKMGKTLLDMWNSSPVTE